MQVWQFTKENYEQQLPEFINNANECPITLWSCNGKLGGELVTSDGVRNISSGDYIVQDATGAFQVFKSWLYERVL